MDSSTINQHSGIITQVTEIEVIRASSTRLCANVSMLREDSRGLCIHNRASKSKDLLCVYI